MTGVMLYSTVGIIEGQTAGIRHKGRKMGFTIHMETSLLMNFVSIPQHKEGKYLVYITTLQQRRHRRFVQTVHPLHSSIETIVYEDKKNVE